MKFELPQLKYEYSALEPYIDAKTMEVHHTKHHAGYVAKLNEAIAGTEFEEKSLEEILKSSELPTAIRNNAGGHWNHTFFWEILSPEKTEASGELAEAISKSFGSFENFKEEFEKAALGRFGSGWAWLVKTESSEFKICSNANQDNPLMANSELKGTPILGLDVWEHAYYLHYQNRRVDYIKAFWNVVDWREVNKKFNEK